MNMRMPSNAREGTHAKLPDVSNPNLAKLASMTAIQDRAQDKQHDSAGGDVSNLEPQQFHNSAVTINSNAADTNNSNSNSNSSNNNTTGKQ